MHCRIAFRCCALRLLISGNFEWFISAITKDTSRRNILSYSDIFAFELTTFNIGSITDLFQKWLWIKPIRRLESDFDSLPLIGLARPKNILCVARGSLTFGFASSLVRTFCASKSEAMSDIYNEMLVPVRARVDLHQVKTFHCVNWKLMWVMLNTVTSFLFSLWQREVMLKTSAKIILHNV